MSDEYKDQRRSVVTLGDVNWAHKRIEELEAKLAQAVEGLGAIYEITVEPAETDHKSVRGWIEVTARNTIAAIQETSHD